MRILLIAIFIGFISISSAKACDFKNMMFGSNSEQVISRFNLDVLDINTTGEARLTEVGKVACDDLPEQSLMEFLLVDDAFIQLRIENPNTTGEMLAFAKKVFGENDDAERSQASDKKNKNDIALWGKYNDMTIVYSSHQQGGKYIEILDISSKKHKNLFEKIAIQSGKSIDAALKASGQGKYSSGYKPGTTSSSSDSDDYDPNALQEMKDRFDRSHEEWKQKQQNK